MPIKPENKALYPSNWNEISEYIRFERAGNKCEVCGVPNYSVGYRDEDGNFIPDSGNHILENYGRGLDQNGDPITYKEAKSHAYFVTDNDELGRKYIVIVLTVAHIDHDPTNCEDENLKAMCQKCHNNHDKEHRIETRRESKKDSQLKIIFDEQ